MISEKLSVDLSEIQAQIRQLESAQRETDSRTSAVMRRVAETDRGVQNLERTADRIFAKLKSQAKQLTKAGVGGVIGSVLDSVDLGDDPLANYGKNILSAGITGLAFGGPVGAGLAALSASVTGLIPMVRDAQQRVEQIEKDRKADMARFEEELARRALDFKKVMEELRFEIQQENQQRIKDTEELTFQSTRYVE